MEVYIKDAVRDDARFGVICKTYGDYISRLYVENKTDYLDLIYSRSRQTDPLVSDLLKQNGVPPYKLSDDALFAGRWIWEHAAERWWSTATATAAVAVADANTIAVAASYQSIRHALDVDRKKCIPVNSFYQKTHCGRHRRRHPSPPHPSSFGTDLRDPALHRTSNVPTQFHRILCGTSRSVTIQRDASRQRLHIPM